MPAEDVIVTANWKQVLISTTSTTSTLPSTAPSDDGKGLGVNPGLWIGGLVLVGFVATLAVAWNRRRGLSQ